MVADCEIDSSHILMISFTNAAAKEMKERYQKIYGQDEVTFCTIHSLCLAILKKFCGLTNDNILSDAQEEVAVSSYQAAYQTYLGYPVILGRQGVVAPVHLSLSAEEDRLLEESANLIRNRVQEAVAFLREKYTNTRE